MNWREFISGIFENNRDDPQFKSKPTFFPPASIDGINDLEANLNTKMPPSLQSLLLETNGVMEMLSIDGGEWSDDMWVIWPFLQQCEEPWCRGIMFAFTPHGN